MLKAVGGGVGWGSNQLSDAYSKWSHFEFTVAVMLTLKFGARE